jgi:hypothetical protein
VIEADEYDTAFFDKRSKFVHYRPRTAVLNNLEFDHADIFDDLAPSSASSTTWCAPCRHGPLVATAWKKPDPRAEPGLLERGAHFGSAVRFQRRRRPTTLRCCSAAARWPAWNGS